MSNRDNELLPFYVPDGEVTNSTDFVIKAFLRVNPRLAEYLAENEIQNALTVKSVHKNDPIDIDFRYNTMAHITTDGCDFVDEHGLPALIHFSYGRWDASLMAFKETNTVGVPDVPLIVETNDKAGVMATFYNLLDDVVLVEDVAGFEGVKLWRGILKRDNPACIYTRWVNGKRIYYGEFDIYAKAYNPERGFEKSDFVE